MNILVYFLSPISNIEIAGLEIRGPNDNFTLYVIVLVNLHITTDVELPFGQVITYTFITTKYITVLRLEYSCNYF